MINFDRRMLNVNEIISKNKSEVFSYFVKK